MIVLQIKPFEIVCKHHSEQLQAAVALDKLCYQLSLTTPDQQVAILGVWQTA